MSACQQVWSESDEWVRWLRLKTAWVRLCGADATPPEVLPYACLSQTQLDQVLLPLGLLACGPALRTLDRHVLQVRVPGSGFLQWRWALRQLQQLDGSHPSELDTLLTPEGRRIQFFVHLLQRLRQAGSWLTPSALQSLLSDCFDAQGVGHAFAIACESPVRVCLPDSVWSSLLSGDVLQKHRE